jgi:hypothetical protein
MAVSLGVGCILTALACALSSVWVVAALFGAVGLGLLDIGWMRLRHPG